MTRQSKPGIVWMGAEHRAAVYRRIFFGRRLCLYQGLGRMRDATALFARANDRDFAQAETLGVAHAPYRNEVGRHNRRCRNSTKRHFLPQGW